MKITKLSALFLAVIMILSCFTTISVFAAESDGATFKADEVYHTKSALTQTPNTVEATLRFPADMSKSSRGGVVVGNFTTMSTVCFSFEIYQNGNPRLYIIDGDKTVHNYIFTDVNLYTGEWVHVAIVKDSSAGEISCYVNGVEKQTISKDDVPADLSFKTRMCLGGDDREKNAQYFKGSIKNVALYSDVRTAAEIKADYEGNFDTDNLIGSYDLVTDAAKFTDKNGKGPDFEVFRPWIKDREPVTDYAYSFAVVGDTQMLNYYYPEKFPMLYKWIANNVEAKKIKYVIGLGDITDKDTVSEWALAKTMLKTLDNKVPYSVVRGNHDTVEMFNKYFPVKEYGSKVSGYYGDNLLNSYHKFNVGDIKYLLLNLDFGPSDEVLDWANGIVAENPDYNVIIATHCYLYHDGTTLDQYDNAAASRINGGNDGDDIWNKLVKKHENIVLVLSGHDPYDQIIKTQKRGLNGNIVTQMLIDPQTTDRTHGGVGLVAMLYFSEDGKNVDVEYYSTTKESYFLEENQFSMTINVIGETKAPETTTPPESSQNPESSETSDQSQTPDQSTNEQTPNDDTKKNNDNTELIVMVVSVVVIVAAIVFLFIFMKKNTKKEEKNDK